MVFFPKSATWVRLGLCFFFLCPTFPLQKMRSPSAVKCANTLSFPWKEVRSSTPFRRVVEALFLFSAGRRTFFQRLAQNRFFSLSARLGLVLSLFLFPSLPPRSSSQLALFRMTRRVSLFSRDREGDLMLSPPFLFPPTLLHCRITFSILVTMGPLTIHGQAEIGSPNPVSFRGSAALGK